MIGGKIAVQSTELQGSTFSFSVKTKIVESAVSSKERETHLVLPAKRILIVDSHPSVQAAVKHFLTRQNIDIQTANQAPEAIKTIRNAADSAQPFDCILVDLALPGMNGIEFINVLHQDSRLKPLQVILMTNQAWTAEAHPPTNVVTGYLAKPLTPAALFPP